MAEAVAGTRIAVAGDLAYPAGSEEDFRRCWEPSWGKLESRIRPAAGNHEYGTEGAEPYWRRFGRRAGPKGRGWYSYDVGAWHVIALNSVCDAVPGGGCARGSEQDRWLRADLRRHADAKCTLVYMHHPPRSSGAEHGSQRQVEPLRRTMAAGGVDVLVSAHEHNYERFAPRDGIREWVIGLGGAGRYEFGEPLPGSEARYNGGTGLLALTLREEGYAWTFLRASGARFEDAGEGRCR